MISIFWLFAKKDLLIENCVLHQKNALAHSTIFTKSNYSTFTQNHSTFIKNDLTSENVMKSS
jgi:hypothetical protein